MRPSLHLGSILKLCADLFQLVAELGLELPYLVAEEVDSL